jgi:hypothetical protein
MRPLIEKTAVDTIVSTNVQAFWLRLPALVNIILNAVLGDQGA